MFFIHPEKFGLIFTTSVLFNILNLRNGCYSVYLNGSDEITNIFRSNAIVKQTEISRDVSRSENFAEGGVIKKPNMNDSIFKTVNSSIIYSDKTYSLVGTKNMTDCKKSIDCTVFSVKHEIEDNRNDNLKSNNTTIKSVIPTKFNETGSNLFLGVPEIIHINGTSSIKPRKGVYYNKIVPRKGVDNENDGNNIFSFNATCFSLHENECSTILDSENKTCVCCKTNISENFKHLPLINCSYCNTVNVSSNVTQNCYSICCKNNVSASQFDRLKPIGDKNKSSESTTKILFASKDESNNAKSKFSQSLNNTLNDEFVNSKKKFKPQITKVPYDVEAVSESMQNSKKFLTPLAVSILLLPLIGILVFFIWRKTKEYWDKRYYRRMDFLIDGMYND